MSRWGWIFGLALFFALAEGLLLYRFAVPAVVWQLYQSEMPHHRLAAPNISHGAGSRDIAYFTMTYDCTEGDVVIEGLAPDARYWQVGIYDRWGRAIDGGHQNHRTIVVEDGRFTVRIAPDRTDERSLDCSGSPRGLFMYRVLLPETEVLRPDVRLVAR